MPEIHNSLFISPLLLLRPVLNGVDAIPIQLILLLDDTVRVTASATAIDGGSIDARVPY